MARIRKKTRPRLQAWSAMWIANNSPLGTLSRQNFWMLQILVLSSETYTKSAPALPPKPHCPELRSINTGFLNSGIQAALPRPSQVQSSLTPPKHCENTFLTFVVDKVSNCTVTLLGRTQASSDCLAELECNQLDSTLLLPPGCIRCGNCSIMTAWIYRQKETTEGVGGKGCLANNFSSHFYLPTYPALSL